MNRCKHIDDQGMECEAEEGHSGMHYPKKLDADPTLTIQGLINRLTELMKLHGPDYPVRVDSSYDDGCEACSITDVCHKEPIDEKYYKCGAYIAIEA